MKIIKSLILFLLVTSLSSFIVLSSNNNDGTEDCISDDAYNYIEARTIFNEDGGSTIKLNLSEVESALIVFNVDASLERIERIEVLFDKLSKLQGSCKFKAEAYSSQDGLESNCSDMSASAYARGSGYLWARASNNRTGQVKYKRSKHPFCANYNPTCTAAAYVNNFTLNAGILR